MSSRPRTLITGATGQIGSAVLRRVAADPALEVVAAVRSMGKAADLGVSTVYLDYDRPETLAPALRGVDRAFMAMGYTVRMFRQSRDFLNAARTADVEHIVHLGGPGDDDTPVEHWLWHQFVERYIEWSGFSFTAGARAGEERVFDSVSKVTGRTPASVEDFVARHRDAFAYRAPSSIFSMQGKQS